MKTRWLPVTLVLVALLASACSNSRAASDEMTLSEIYAAVAITVAAQANTAIPTATSMPTRISAPMSTMSFVSTATPTTSAYSASYVASSSCNSSAYVSDVTIDDGTELAPGESFTKTWEVSNNGTCNWSKHYFLVFVSGDDMDGDNTEIDQKVGTGETAEVSVELTAPEDEGTYTGYWSLADTKGNLFGQKVYVEIMVSEDAATSTPTATASATPSLTPTATAPTTPSQTPTATAAQATSTATVTSVPATATNTATATPTDNTAPTLEERPTETPRS